MKLNLAFYAKVFEKTILRKSKAGSYITHVLILLLPSFCRGVQTEEIGRAVSNVCQILFSCMKLEAQLLIEK
jgi:hypothetical protein